MKLQKKEISFGDMVVFFFFLGGGEEVLKKKTTLVKWSIVYTYKRKGALGVRSFFSLNKTLLCKWS